jgi:acyl transferase domain-containing protein/NADPH:quinone reductase-like Zn-dependent oxidoreductase/SAM-dependent methyltransferase/acyl carrier protein
MHKDRIAIIGIGCRFPGGVNDAESFWKLLVEGRDAVTDVPADRWNVERYYDPEPGIPGKTFAKRAGFLDQIDQFDPQFFGISPREAPYVDPQHRLLLETAWEAIENAGLVLDLEKGSDVGVFVGISHNDYQGIQSTAFDHFGIAPHTPTGSAHSIAANRISYCLNLRGPSVAMDTACSSALTAVHTACEHIWAGRGGTALAGGVTVMITPGGFIGFSQASMLSPDGRCAAFDTTASGFVRGEGAGMVLLKRLSQAIADGDPIQGVIVGTALNQDGHTNGISLPSAEAQARLVQDACKDARVSPNQIGFVEAHGTGTAVGDPIEAHALAEALCQDRTSPLPIGSVKTNVGHLETAAGVAGLVKAMLVLQHREIPGSLHFTSPNPHIDFDKLKLRVPTALEPFPETDGERLAGVNSFGFGGANAHVILAEPPAAIHGEHAQIWPERSWPVTLSARSEDALRGCAIKLASWLSDRQDLNGDSPLLPDLTYTLGDRRNHHPHRLTLVASSIPDLIQELDAFAVKQDSVRVRTSFTPRPEHAARIAFIMSGQGPQWWGMGRQLMQNEPVFRQVMEQCDAALRGVANFSLLEELGRSEEASQLHRTEIAQPAIFAMQVGLAELWKSWGVHPAAVVGHSVSEIAAACVAGLLTLEQGARVTALRARFMENCARGEGKMLAVGLSEAEAQALIDKHDPAVSIAAFNGPRSLTLAGPRQSIEAIFSELELNGVFARLVRVDHPFHHAMMQPAAEALENALTDFVPHEESIPFFSTVTGTRISGSAADALHWANGIRQPVQFASAINAIADSGVDIWLELGAHPALAHSIAECLAGRGESKPVVISSVRREREHDSMLEAAMDLHRAGVPLDFKTMTPSRRLLRLPAYAWDRSRWWNEAPDWREGRLAAGGRGMLDMRLPCAKPTWMGRLDNRHMAFLKDHKVESHVIFPAAAFVDLALEAGQQLFEGRPFVIEDFEIRKPLILADPAAGVQIEVSYEPNDRTFAIQSRFDQGASWSLHVVGSMRGERTESGFAACKLDSESDRAAAALNPVDIEAFYRYMSDLGLRYGEEFRSVRQLSAGEGESAGRVVLSESSAARSAEYPLHPVLLDGALHIFSAGRATVEARGSQLKLPVRFGRILFLHSPGASARVRANVIECNSEFVEGRIELYDDSGKPSVLIDGFRAISVAGLRRDTLGGPRDVLYHTDWERTAGASNPPTLKPVALSRLKESAQHALNDVIETRGQARLKVAIAAQDDLAAVLLCAGLRTMGARAGADFTADTLRIAPAMRPVFGQLISKLQKRSLLSLTERGHRPTAAFKKAADSAVDAERAFIEKNPGHLPEALLVAGTCAELGPILRGEKDAVQVLFAGAGADLLDQFYGDGLLTSHWLAAITAAVQEAARALPEGRGLRILEVGAGTGGLTAHLLPALERGLHSYTFTDVSAAFFAGAMQKLAAFPEIETKTFDLEKPATEQGFEPGSFDFVVGTNVLHAVADVRSALRNLHGLLVPGGSLVFMDVATPQLWTEAVFGLTSGWWRFTDRDLRSVHPLLGRSQWEQLLQETGFAETASIPGLVGAFGEGQIGILGRKGYETPAAAQSVNEVPTGKSWLIFADEGGIGKSLAERLRSSGAHCRTVHRGTAYRALATDTFTIRPEAPEDWRQLLQACAGEELERIVYLWNLDTEIDYDAVVGTDALLHLAQALDAVLPGAKLRIDSITRGAQPVGRDVEPTAVAQAPAIGLLRVILNEYPNYLCRGIDLPPGGSAAELNLIWTELLRTESEREVALRGDARYVQRIDRGRPSIDEELDPAVPLRLEARERGHLDRLKFSPFVLPRCGPGEVMIDVKAAGMNFRDVLKALALYPGDAPDARIFGDEVAGIVTAVGSNVRHLKPGDRVFGLAVFGLATQTLARGGDIRRIPDDLSFEEAATIPVVFMTSWHALKKVARLGKGDTVLIHAGAGGVGMAAIQIAHHLGAEVIASAGSTVKRALLTSLGVKHVIDSRRGDFTEAVMELTSRRGVDVVLNALAGEAIPMGLSCLAEFGRFIEIGKRDIYQNSRIPLRPLRANASFHVVAMDAVFGGDESLTREMFEEISDLVEDGALRPLPFRAFPAMNVDAAFRLMASGKHIGKVVVSLPQSFIPLRGEPIPPNFEIKKDGSYLITGAFGGFGKVIANWLVQSGARHLVLSSRSGASTPEAEGFVQSLRARGVEVLIVKADAGSPEDISRLFARIHKAAQPLRGVFHLAMVIDDAVLAQLNRERMAAVIGPKALGAWLLHQATRDMHLDCFVMFSSISSIFGNPAQGNYSAANAFLDSLAHHRRALGLPALTINWGVLGGEGYVARNKRVAEFLEKQGTTEISPAEVISIVESSLRAGTSQVAAIRVDWAKWRSFFRGMQDNPLLRRIFATIENDETGRSTSDWRNRIQSAPADQKETVIAQAVREVVGSVLRVKPDTLRDDQPLTDLGLDSLMGVEIENSLEAAIGVALPPTSLMRARTIGQIAALMLAHMGGSTAATPAISAPTTPASPDTGAVAAEVDFDALSSDEIDQLIGKGDDEDPLLEAAPHA